MKQRTIGIWTNPQIHFFVILSLQLLVDSEIVGAPFLFLWDHFLFFFFVPFLFPLSLSPFPLSPFPVLLSAFLFPLPLSAFRFPRSPFPIPCSPFSVLQHDVASPLPFFTARAPHHREGLSVTNVNILPLFSYVMIKFDFEGLDLLKNCLET